MKYSYTIFLSTLLGGGVFAANSKLNQYATISDCQNDVNIISHSSPVIDTCHTVDSRTGALFLVTGGGAAGAIFQGSTLNDCSTDSFGTLAEGSCIAAPGGIESIAFFVPV
ncbi:hypothetical protein V8E51_015388 [Hyaloscypha variabilis]|uniref:Cyanovirin-N domain-containing protein n=1 Tax=Hyaloscypha variabilis (strain UAMH 11265 / GT02V1 / F) TaxID=1149755 RepID=A0A2J6QWQ2_HYAVF|nr:hypothetical protein L207DRAFT_641593 [Hyaloscypha variabilis F]